MTPGAGRFFCLNLFCILSDCVLSKRDRLRVASTCYFGKLLSLAQHRYSLWGRLPTCAAVVYRRNGADSQSARSLSLKRSSCPTIHCVSHYNSRGSIKPGSGANRPPKPSATPTWPRGGSRSSAFIWLWCADGIFDPHQGFEPLQ